MADTFLGRRFARNIKRGLITIDDVPTAFYNDTLDSYMELYGVPLEVVL